MTIRKFTAIGFAVLGATLHAQNWSGPIANDGFGNSIAIIDDIDSPRDGQREVLVGAFVAGRAYVHRLGSTTPVRTHTGSANNRYGELVSDIGNINNDSYSDYAVAAPATFISTSATGRLFIYSGANGALLLTLSAPSGSQFFGFRAVPLGDLNNDSLDDFAVAAVGINVRGEVHVYLSSSTGYAPASYSPLRGSPSATQVDGFGTGLAFLGGSSNTIAIGAPTLLPISNRPNAGGVFRWNLTATTATPLGFVSNNVTGEQFGTSVAAVPDVNNDQVTDFAVGIPYLANGTRGGVAMYSGSTGLRLWQYAAGAANIRLGHWGDAIGDADGDGAGDVIAGAISGPYQVLSGANGALIRSISIVGGPVDAGPDVLGNGGCDILAGHFGTGVGTAQIVYLAENKLLGVGCSFVAAPPTLSVAGRPTLGANLTATGRSFYSTSVPATLYASIGPFLPVQIGACTAYVGSNLTPLASGVVNSTTGTFSFTQRVPTTAAIGSTVVLQMAYAPNATTTDLSNAVVLRIGVW